MAEEIWHHGIKGMHWGERRTPEQLGHAPKGGKKSESKPKVEPHEDYKKAHDSKNVKAMSDAELRARLNRLNMEKQYSQMNSTRVQRGRQVLNTTIKVAGTVAAASTTAITIKNNWGTISGWFGKG
jgi:hypothetical protein